MKRLVLLVAANLIFVLFAFGNVDCPGDYAKHLQGTAADDGGNIYWSFTTVLVKTDGQMNTRASCCRNVTQTVLETAFNLMTQVVSARRYS